MINQIIMDGGAQQVQERRSAPPGLSRAPGQVRTDRVVSVGDTTESTPGFGFSDRLSKGLGGRVATPEWQQKIGLSRGIQIADQAMGEIDQELQQAKEDLMKIHKMFPPYPQGSEERAELLNSYKSLRLQIDRLTFPPESNLESNYASVIMGNSSELEGEPLSVVGQFPVYSGEGGLGLVEIKGLVEKLEDSELPALIKNLEHASGVLYERRASLEISAGKIFNQEAGEDVVFSKLSVEVQEQLSVYDLAMGRSETGVHQELSFLG